MKIEHIAMYVDDVYAVRDFFVKYFEAVANEGYHNQKTDFRSFFLSFHNGARLEIMNKPKMFHTDVKENQTGYIHLAFSVGGQFPTEIKVPGGLQGMSAFCHRLWLMFKIGGRLDEKQNYCFICSGSGGNWRSWISDLFLPNVIYRVCSKDI